MKRVREVATRFVKWIVWNLRGRPEVTWQDMARAAEEYERERERDRFDRLGW